MSPKAKAAPDSKKISSDRYIRTAVIGTGLAIPALSLIPLGSIWLWQKGFLLYWAIGVFVTTGIAWGLQRYLIAHGKPEAEKGTEPHIAAETPLEEEAWRQVRDLARTASPGMLMSQDTALGLGIDVVDRVARVMRPGVVDPFWHFTSPELLALIERVSSQLRRFVDEAVPLSDRLTIAQFIQLYRWRGVIDAAETAYDAWRILRLLNPVTAVTHELRERLSKELLTWSKEHIARRLVEVYVEEVGRAAIDLYSGRLRVIDTVETAPATAAAPLAPIQIFVGGQTGAGKSRLVNALAKTAGAAADVLPTTDAFTAYTIVRDDLAGALVIDSPGLHGSTERREKVIEAAAGADLVVWVVAAHRADREIDRAALAELRQHFAERPDRRPPPIMLVLSHIDQLRPWSEWQPPYDVAAPSTPKAQAIRDAAVAVAGDLDIPLSDVIPTCLDASVGLYNVDAVWARILALVPEARQTQLIRMLRSAGQTTRWKKVWNQALGAGRVIGQNMLGTRPQ